MYTEGETWAKCLLPQQFQTQSRKEYYMLDYKTHSVMTRYWIIKEKKKLSIHNILPSIASEWQFFPKFSALQLL